MGDGKALAHSYRNLQYWNQWLSQQFLGTKLLEAEKKQFAALLERHFGKHAGLIGVPYQSSLFNATQLLSHTLITPLSNHKLGYVESDLYNLPILTGSMDLIMLPHTLEFIDNPRQLLVEACRIIKPEGLILISGFNPYSLWGLKKKLAKNKPYFPEANFINARKIINWLKLADFVIEKQKFTLFVPPINNEHLLKKFSFLEKLNGKWFPNLGGVYIILARAKVVPFTPIRLKWKQQLSGVRISTSIPGNIAR